MDLDADFDLIKAAGVAILIGASAALFFWGWNKTVGKHLFPSYLGPMGA